MMIELQVVDTAIFRSKSLSDNGPGASIATFISSGTEFSQIANFARLVLENRSMAAVVPGIVRQTVSSTVGSWSSEHTEFGYVKSWDN